MSITQLNPPIPLMTPKGRAMAHFLIDYGVENDLMWVCFQDAGLGKTHIYELEQTKQSAEER